MKTCAVRRRMAWWSPEAVDAVIERAIRVARSEFPADIRWIRSYVIVEPDGSLGSICIYQATDDEAIRRHAQRVGMPADVILDVADTLVIRADPAWEVDVP
jgi:alkanesulfonate monooxygenase SsuD/methylene tetrahydromethanopterin reductase-like flavin-dependent oxidoreductase (luciferase family)